jgi:hypothetical protein
MRTRRYEHAVIAGLAGFIVVAGGCAPPAPNEERGSRTSDFRAPGVQLPRTVVKMPSRKTEPNDPCDVGYHEYRPPGCGGQPSDSYEPPRGCTEDDLDCPGHGVMPGRFRDEEVEEPPGEPSFDDWCDDPDFCT